MLSLLRSNRDFSIYATSQWVSYLGDSATNVVLPLIVLKLTGSPSLVAAIAVIEALPYFLLHLPFGALLDRLDRRRLMIFADLARGVLLCVIPLVSFLDGPVLLGLFLIAAPLGLSSSIFDIGHGTITPTLVKREDLSRAYALVEGGESVAWVAGPAIAGVLVTVFGPANALLLDGFSFFGSALGLALIRLPKLTADSRQQTIWRDILEGMRFLASTPRLRSMQMIWTFYGVIGYGAVTGLVYIGSHGGAGSATLASWAVSAYALGSVAGTIGASRHSPGRIAAAVAIALLVLAGGAALIAIQTTIGVMAGAFCIGAGEGFLLVVYLTARAENTPADLMGRITSMAQLLDRSAGMLAVTWMGLALEWFDGRTAFVLLALAALALVPFAFKWQRALAIKARVDQKP